MTTIAISLIQSQQEREYVNFPVTAEGLQEAAAKLDTKVYQGHYTVSPWQFDDPWGGQQEQAVALLRAGDVDGLRRHMAASEPKY